MQGNTNAAIKKCIGKTEENSDCGMTLLLYNFLLKYNWLNKIVCMCLDKQLNKQYINCRNTQWEKASPKRLSGKH